MRINGLHRAVLKDYADGDVGHLAKEDEISDPRDLGDSLLTFMLIELSGKEDCDDVATGIERLTQGRDDLDVALKALEALLAAMPARLAESQA